jgi:hypothetical protein
MATDAVLAPDSATVLPIYCVEKRRWEGKKEFAPTVTVAPQAVRERAAQSAGQAEVWDEVARANVRLKSSSSSEDLAAGMTKPENARRLGELRKHVVDRLPDNCAGIVVARGGTIIGADLFNSADLFATMRQRVLDSYLSQYALEEGDRPMRVMPDQREVREYLQGCYRSRLAAEDMRGVGQVYGISGNRTGRMLAYEPRFAVEVRERPIRPANQYMVHTSLMQEVIPVRPRPIPMPQGRPER